MKTVICLNLAISALLLSCQIQSQESSAVADDRDIESLSSSNSRFAFSLYSQIAKGSGENIFISPFSVSSALAIAYEGANSSTEEEMRKTLAFDKSKESTAIAFHKTNLLIQKDSTKDIALKIANAAWMQKGHKFLDSYTGIIAKYFSGGLKELDFQADPEAARKEINLWVENKTEEKIKDLIPERVITNLTRFVITNAVYFKGTWKKPFKKERTREMPFFCLGKTEKKIPFMNKSERVPYCEDDTLQMISLPYLGNTVSMNIILPKDRDGIMALEQKMNGEEFLRLKKSAAPRSVKIFVPRFKIEKSYSLKEYLETLGMRNAFTDQADFSGIDGTKNFLISAVIHKSFLDVNEEGTEASAATAVMMEVTAMPPQDEPTFKADHPFLLLIVHEASKTILFMGRYAEPL